MKCTKILGKRKCRAVRTYNDHTIINFTLYFSLVIFLIVCFLFFLMLRLLGTNKHRDRVWELTSIGIELQMEVVGEIGVARARGAGGRS